MKRVDYDERLHGVYARGRVMSPTTVTNWLDAFERRLPEHRPLALVDVGSGTGRWTPSLAERFGGPVVGVEPSARMRDVAEAQSAHPQVSYRAGSAESIPLDDATCDGGLVYFVWHHVPDKDTAAAELQRVIRPGGRLLVRSNFSDRMPELWWYRDFPRAEEVDTQMYQPVATVIETFTAKGWEHVALDEIDVVFAENRRADLDRLKLKALSTFEHLTDAETEEGFAALERALTNGPAMPEPVVTRGDLLVFARP